MKLDRRHVIGFLEEGLSQMDRVLLKDSLKLLADQFLSLLSTSGRSFDADDPVSRGILLMEFLLDSLRQSRERIAALKELLADFNTKFSRSASEHERIEHMLQLSQRLGTTGRQLRQDREAFKRWFGYDGIVERVNRRVSECEYELAVALNVLGGVGPLTLIQAGDTSSQDQIWRRFKLGDVFKVFLVFQGDHRVRIQAFKCLAGCVAALSPETRTKAVDAGTLGLIYRSALDTAQNVWIQCEALKLLVVLDTDSFSKALKQRLMHPREGDDIFFRRRAVLMMGQHFSVDPELVNLVSHVLQDPSPYVRQGLTEAVGGLLSGPSEECSKGQPISWSQSLALHDPSAQVRAAMLSQLTANRILPNLEALLALFAAHFTQEQDTFVIRAGLNAAALIAEELGEEGLWSEAKLFASKLVTLIETLHQSAADLSVRRWAAMARERIHVAVNPESMKLKRELQEFLKVTKPGRSKRLPSSLIRPIEEDLLGRVLSVISQDDFGISIRYGVFGARIIRGDNFGFRFWRFLNEFLSPSPDKRQGYSHTVGRTTDGHLRAPSAIVSELSQTKVPGEPLFMASESGWRPYLPLVDDVLTTAKRWFSRKRVKFFTSEGVTELEPPRSLARRLMSVFALTLRFPHYASLRNWSDEENTKPDSYIRALERLGFSIRYRGYTSDHLRETSDRSVARFFAAAFPFVGIETWHRFTEYFVSAYENSLYQLGMFAAGLLAFFIGQRTYLGWAVRKSRKSFNLVMGGWGTRGKSGTERLKTAIVEALGHGLVAKTTGCEAMFLHAYPFGKTREMFIYRSYDKATIWEHHNIMVMGKALGCKVFLWECMGLNPSFVRILQRQWSIDDYSTITNTYPDHEDIQGPAGINIPEVMTNFIPKGRVLVTSEQEMKPVLRWAAQELGTRFVSVGWLEAGLLTPDVLSRFPYEEHPTNIALALALAGELGIERDFALKEMADRVVPDIGVLKVFPRAKVRNRWLEFINGMSANERFATLTNWTRMGFDVTHPEIHPGVMISTVVNNRADRLSRSRVFASILVEDITADRHFLIGSNVSGLMGLIKEAWVEHAHQVTILPRDEEDTKSPEERATNIARRMRIPVSRDQIRDRLAAMLAGLDAQVSRDDLETLLTSPEAPAAVLGSTVSSDLAKEIAGHVQQQLTRLREYEEVADRIRGASRDDLTLLDKEFREIAGQWFMSRFIVIEDYHASGDQIIDRICRETPPGILNRVMGIQNIKGTGLDFVYRWLAWEKCHQVCKIITSDGRQETLEQAVSELTAFQEFGILCEDEVIKTLAIARARPVFQTERLQAEFALIESNMNQMLSPLKATLGATPSTTWWRRIIDSVEAFLDAGDAIRRTKTANRIYKDLVDERISHDRAAIELKQLNRRQAGGWLAAWLGIQDS